RDLYRSDALGSPQRTIDGEPSRVRESIQNLFPFRQRAKMVAVPALIKEEPRFLTALDINDEFHHMFLDLHIVGDSVSPQDLKLRRKFFDLLAAAAFSADISIFRGNDLPE